jgi:hypothetical protein
VIVVAGREARHRVLLEPHGAGGDDEVAEAAGETPQLEGPTGLVDMGDPMPGEGGGAHRGLGGGCSDGGSALGGYVSRLRPARDGAWGPLLSR